MSQKKMLSLRIKKEIDKMSKVISIKGLPDNIIRRIVSDKISDVELAYANIETILLISSEDERTRIVFDVKSEWNYVSDMDVPELLSYMGGKNSKNG